MENLPHITHRPGPTTEERHAPPPSPKETQAARPFQHGAAVLVANPPHSPTLSLDLSLRVALLSPGALQRRHAKEPKQKARRGACLSEHMQIFNVPFRARLEKLSLAL
ncbi:hypothetical protein HYQ44_000199 [Verticillium longisporum]|nr:hypothetical protein HYQ44_000199 [Verticillium longisporum]